MSAPRPDAELLFEDMRGEAPGASDFSRDRRDEIADVTAGPETLCATVRVDDPRWGERDAAALTDSMLTGLGASRQAPRRPVTLDVVFTDDAALAALNARFRGRAGATNVLSFPSGEGPDEDGVTFLGGMALAYDTCLAEARARGIHFAHHATHLTLHGALHLFGFDHESEADAAAMEEAEVNVLASLGIDDPYREG